MIGACEEMFCDDINDPEAAAMWSRTPANSENVIGSCYEGLGGVPLRECNADGTWSDARNYCTSTHMTILLLSLLLYELLVWSLLI